MKLNAKRLVAILLIAMLVLSVSGCQKVESTPTPASAAPASSAPASAAPASAAPVESKAPEKLIKDAVTMVVTFSAGGSNDLGSRVMSKYLEKYLEVPVNVVNITGGGGWIGWQQVAQAKPDGLTLSSITFPTLFVGYMDPQQNRKENMSSFTQICNVISDYGVLTIASDNKNFNDMDSFIEYVKNNPVNISVTAKGGDDHMGLLKFLAANPELAANVTPVFNSGTTDCLAQILGGHTDATFVNVGDMVSRMSDGTFTNLCIFAPERSKYFPDLQTCEELGYGAVYESSDRGFGMPHCDDPALLAYITDAFKAALSDPDCIKEFADLGLEMNVLFGADSDKLIADWEQIYNDNLELLGWK